MMITRRNFLRQITLAGGSALLLPFSASRLLGKTLAPYFAVHTFIENNPEAVFIMKTAVDVKTNAAAIKQAGLDFGSSVFVGTDNAEIGIPLDHAFAMKPNLTAWEWDNSTAPFEQMMGVITDVNFMEGIIESMKLLGISADHIHIREVNGSENLTRGGYNTMASRTGADVQVIGESITTISDSKIKWVDVPDGYFFKRIPYLSPINAQNSWLLNIAKFKAHGMGLTLCAKNLQGSIVNKYQGHCDSYNAIKPEIDRDHVQQDTFKIIKANYDRHVADNIPRWDTSGWDSNGGLGMETWASRCTDNNSVTRPGLHVIEGVYGRDGNGFYRGPHNGAGKDFMTNIIIFGKNAYHVDIIGHYLGGHEPGNFGLFHLARERDLSAYLNPRDIALYEWKNDGSAMLAELSDFDRTPLLTPYLQQKDEEDYHMLDEPYDYSSTAIPDKNVVQKPESFILNQNYPNPFNPTTTIQFNLNKAGNVRIDIYNSLGERIDVLTDGFYRKGSHMVNWNAGKLPSGNYFYRMRSSSFSETKRMVVLK
jgi:hypothetical protein